MGGSSSEPPTERVELLVLRFFEQYMIGKENPPENWKNREPDFMSPLVWKKNTIYTKPSGF